MIYQANTTLKMQDYFNGRRARDRVHMLIDKYRAEEMESLRASGAEEEYDERAQLLTDLVAMIDDTAILKTADVARKEKEKRQGEELRQAALEGLRREQSEDVDPTLSESEASGSGQVLRKRK